MNLLQAPGTKPLQKPGIPLTLYMYLALSIVVFPMPLVSAYARFLSVSRGHITKNETTEARPAAVKLPIGDLRKSVLRLSESITDRWIVVSTAALETFSDKPLLMSLNTQLWPVCRFTLAYSKGFSTRPLHIPAMKLAVTVLYSRPHVMGIYVASEGCYSHLVKRPSKTEKTIAL